MPGKCSGCRLEVSAVAPTDHRGWGLACWRPTDGPNHAVTEPNPFPSLEVLDYARRDIINSKGRVRDVNDMDIPADLLPGALALMAEVRAGRQANATHGPSNWLTVSIPAWLATAMSLSMYSRLVTMVVQVGQCELTITIGGELLASPDGLSPLVQKDVRLSMALANCYLAGNCLEEGQVRLAMLLMPYPDDGVFAISFSTEARG